MWYIWKKMNTFSQNEIEEIIKLFSIPNVKKYCEILWLDLEKFLSWISFSYWELLEWYNRTIVADNTIKWRYHIVTRWNWVYNYFVYDNWVIILDWISDPHLVSSVTELPKDLVKWLTKLISFYESIRNLEKFNPNHCPVIEAQTTNDWENYFLQYHRTRDTDYSTFTLNRPLEDWEIKADFVRGITPEDWVEIDVIVGSRKEHFNWYGWAFSQASFKPVFNEIQTKKVRLILMDQWIDWVTLWIALWWHLGLSDLFNPEISLVLPEWFYKKFIWEKYREFSKKTWKDAIMRVRIISDWRRAYFKIIWNNLWEI
jgi:hypothetical protein